MTNTSETTEIEATTELGQSDSTALVMPRYSIDNRSGIIAIYDRHHPDYEELPGCHQDYPFVVASWTGFYDDKKGYWDIEQWKVDKANSLLKELNDKAV